MTDALPSLQSASDEQLTARILAARPNAARDEENELCRRFAPRVRRYGMRHLRDPHAADDLVQRVLGTLVDDLRARKLRDAAAIGSFVLAMTRALATAEARGAQRREQLLHRFGADLHPAAPAEPSPDLPRLRDCMGKLAERSRTLLVMTFFAGWDSARIGGELGLSDANVRVMRHRALRQLLQCIEGEE